MNKIIAGIKEVYEEKKAVHDQLRDLRLDGSTDFQIIFSMKSNMKQKRQYAIFTKTQFRDNIGLTQAGSKLLYIEDGRFHLQINSYGSM